MILRDGPSCKTHLEPIQMMDCVCGRMRVVEAHETVALASSCVPLSHDFCAHDLAVFSEYLPQLLVGHIVRNVKHEQIGSRRTLRRTTRSSSRSIPLDWRPGVSCPASVLLGWKASLWSPLLPVVVATLPLVLLGVPATVLRRSSRVASKRWMGPHPWIAARSSWPISRLGVRHGRTLIPIVSLGIVVTLRRWI